jgi:predicted nuclease of predicted toxin-antitoxin system
VLVTLDKDFGELAIRYNLPNSGILRFVETPVVEQAALCEQMFERHGAALIAGALITADLERIRVRLTNG